MTLFASASTIYIAKLVIISANDCFSPVNRNIVLLLVRVNNLNCVATGALLVLLLKQQLGLHSHLTVRRSVSGTRLTNDNSLILSVVAIALIIRVAKVFYLCPAFDRSFNRKHDL